MIIKNNSIIPVWKPCNLSSFDVIRKVKKISSIEKIGHAGTLDPFAEGVLVLCTGTKTTESSTIMGYDKSYRAHIQMGDMTDTLDTEGQIIQSIPVPSLTEENIKSALKRFIGRIMQVPPYFCALKKNGVPLYKFARSDIFIRMKPRPVDVYSLKLVSYKNSVIVIDILCGKGTYVRSLGLDIAKSLGTTGYLTALSRQSIGDFNKENSISLEHLIEDC